LGALSVGAVLVRLLAAFLLGALLGLERETRVRPAGLRTHILVSLASATFMLVSTQFVYFQHYANNGLVRVDPSRIASGVVMGMGFLGAGSILRTGLDVHGLTTAASLWMVSAVGLAAGCGMFPEAVTATGAALFVLVGLSLVESKHKRKVKRRVKLELDENQPTQAELQAVLNNLGVPVTKIAYDRDLVNHLASLRFDVTLPVDASVGPLLAPIESLPGVRRVRVKDAGKDIED
jgi:putative Mg2+ transporter-C (MgtC) family protein